MVCFFVTQNPSDIPDGVLGQLGMKMQHALRAFTAKDRKAIRLAAQNYPLTDYYETSTLLTELGIGEALFTALNEKGIPTPLAHVMLRAPQSRMDVLTDREINQIIDQSNLIDKYNDEVDRDSAYEILGVKIEESQEEERQEKLRKQREKENRSSSRGRRRSEKSTIEKVLGSTTTRQIGRTVARELTRGLLGVLGLGGRSKKKKGSWF